MQRHEKISAQNLQRIIVGIITAMFAISAAVTLTLAWSNMSQGATNPAMNERWEFEVELEKFERDVNGNETEIRLQGAQFALFRIEDDGSETQIGDVMTTDDEGRINVTNLSPGNYVFVEILPPNNYTFDSCECCGYDYITRYYFTIADNHPIDETVQVRAFNQRLNGDLIITKTVEGNPPNPYQEFEFIVTFSDGGTYYWQLNGEGDLIEHISGEILRLQHNQSAVFRNLPAGITYTVTEVPTLGFSVSSNNHQGTIIADEEQTAEFTNTWLDEHGTLRVTKEVVGITSDTYFEFIAIVGGVEHRFTLRHGEEWILENLPIGTEFVVTEIPRDGYTATVLYFQGTITEAGVVIHLPFVNVWDEDLYDEYGSLRITKEVPGDSDTEFTFTVTFGNLPAYPVEILINGTPAILSLDNYEFIFQLRSGEYWLFENIPHGTTFTVTETLEDGYTASIITANGVISGNVERTAEFINYRDDDDDATITIEKIVEGDMPNPDQLFEFVLEIEGQDPYHFTLANGESRTFDVPAGVTYTITEINIPPGFSLINVENGHGTTAYGIIATFTNRYDGTETIDIEGEKTWYYGGHEVTLPNYITVRLMNSDIIVREITVTPDAYGRWFYEFTNLPRYDADGYEIEYTIVELPIEGWEPNYNDFDIENRYIGYRYIDISVRKVWADNNNPNRPTSIQVQLYRDGTAYGEPVILNAANGWSHTWISLERGSEWTVDELNVPEGYTAVITGDAESGFVITNTLEEGPPTGTITICGIKRWEHGRNPESAHPPAITIIIFANGERYMSFLLTERDHWSWSFELNRYDTNGNPIIWTIAEEYVGGYREIITGDGENGFVITNRHISVDDPDWPGDGQPPTDPGPDSPPTGDNNNILLWAGLMVVSMLTMIIMAISRKKKKDIPPIYTE